MDKVLGIITEYNPFHNGHLYHLKESKKITNCKYTICVMSGNFTQRGSTSLIDKWSKTKMALENGVDLVIELPVLYSISSAENFASGAIKILDSINIVSDICFGSECNNIDILNKVANILVTEPYEFKTLLSSELSKGISFAKARENVCLKYLNIQNNILSTPNNILGIEYLKAIKKLNSNINPHIISRTESNYNSLEIKNNIASSTAIRNIIKQNKNNLDILKNVMPESSYSILIENLKNSHLVTDISLFEKEILYTLRKMPLENMANLAEIREGLENKIKKACNTCNNLEDFFNIVKSKRFTRTCIQRILLYSLLDITKQDMQISKEVTPYIHILGFNNNGKKLISEISKSNPNINLVTSIKKFENTCTNNKLKYMLKKDILATNIYTLAYNQNSLANLDYTTPIISI